MLLPPLLLLPAQFRRSLNYRKVVFRSSDHLYEGEKVF